MMDDQQIFEIIDPTFFTLSTSDQVLACHTDQLTDCTNIILESDTNQDLNTTSPLNDLLEQSFEPEINDVDRPFFVDGEQLITFRRPISLNKPENSVQTTSTIEFEEPIEEQEISFTTNSDNIFPDINIDVDKINSDNDIVKTDDSDLTERLDILSNINIDITNSNYSNSTAIKILEDVANTPIDINGNFVCDLCLHKFYKWQNYKKHKLEHLNDKPFKCSECIKSFNYNNNYLLHVASHLTNNLKCPQCKKVFNRQASFKAHLKSHRTEETITCNICQSIFDNQYRLDIHKKNCNTNNSNIDEDSTEEENIVTENCKTCNKSLSSLVEYKRHAIEHKKFDLVLKKQYKFNMKVKKMLKKKNSVKQFKCDHCDWSFEKSIYLRRHMRKHTGEKPYKCPHCSKYFSQENTLNRHLLKHTGSRPFKCEFCAMSFSQKSHLINHIKLCHAVTREATRIHKCTICSCIYNSVNALSKHLSVYHGKKTKKPRKYVRKRVSECTKVNNNDDTNESIHIIKDPSHLEEWLEEVAQELQIGNNNTELMHSDNKISAPREIELDLPDSVDYDDIERNFSLMSNSKNNTETNNLISTPQNGTVNIVAKKNPEQAAPIKYYSIVNNQGKKFVLKCKKLIPSKKPTKTILINDNKNELIPLSVKENAKNVVLNGNINESILPSLNESILQREIELDLPDSVDYDDIERNFSLLTNSKNNTETDNLNSTPQNGTVNIVAKKNPEQAAPIKYYSIVNNQGKKFVLKCKKLIPSKKNTKTILINDNTNKSIPLSVKENAKNVVLNGNINESILPSLNKSILQREIELDLPDSVDFDDIERNFSLISNSKNTTETDNLINTLQNGTVNIVGKKNPEQAAPNKYYSIVNKQGKKFVLNGKKLIPSKNTTKTILINDNTNESIPLSVEENAKNVVVNGNINESILPSFNESILQREIELHLPDSDVYDDIEKNFSLISNSKITTETDNLISTLQNGTVNIVAKKNPEQAAPKKYYSIVNKQGKKFVLNGKKLIPSKNTTKTILINDNTNESIPLSVEENAKNVVVNGNINESILPSFNESILQREIELHLPDSDVYDDIERNFSLISNSKNTTETDNLISTLQNGTVNIVTKKNPEQAAPKKYYSIVNKQGKKFVLNGKKLIPSKNTTKTILINDNTNESIPLSVEENAINVVVNGNINEAILPSFNESILQREIELHLPDSDVYDDIERNFSLMTNSKNTTETDNLISILQNGTVNFVAKKNPEQAAPNKYYSIVNKQGKKFVLNGKKLIPSKNTTKTILINDNTNESIPLSVEENAKNVVVNGNINESILPSFNESILQREIELHLPDSDVYDDIERNFSLISNSKNTTETDNLISTLQNGTVNIVTKKNPEQAAPKKYYSIVNKQGKKFVLNGKKLIPSKNTTKTILINDNTNESIPLSVEENAKNVVVNGNINESILPSFNDSILHREIELDLPDSVDFDDIERNFSLISNSKNTTETDNLISTLQNGTVNIVTKKNPEQAAPKKYYSIVNKQGKKFVLNGKKLIPSKNTTKTILINDNTNESIPLSVEENAKNVVVNGNINESILPSFNDSILQREIELDLPDSVDFDDIERNFSLISNSKNTTETDNLISTLQNGTVNIVTKKNPEQAAPKKYYSIVNKQGKKFVLNGKKLIPSKNTTKTILINDNTNESIPLSVEENAINVVVNGNINEAILPSFNESILQREIELHLPDSDVYDDIERNFSLMTNSKNTTETDNLISTLQNGTVNNVAKKNPEQAAPNKFYSIVNKQGKKFVLNGKNLIPSKKSTKTILINDNTNESIPLSVEENAKNVVVNGNINESILPSFNESILQREIELHLPDSDVYDDFETNFSLMSNSKNTTETDNLISTLQNGTVNYVAKKNPEQAAPNKFYSIVNKQGKKFVLNGKKLIPSKNTTKTILINDNTNESIPLSVEENAKNVVVNGNINESILPSFNDSILQREIELDLPDSVDFDDIERNFSLMSNSKNITETDNLFSTPQNGTVNNVAKKNPEQAAPNKFYSIVNKQGKKFVLNGKNLIPSKKSTKTILINDNTNESIPLSVEENAKNVVVNGNINESILPSFNESILQREIELHLPDSDVYDDFETNFSLMSNSKNTTETDNLISTLQNGTVNYVAKKNPEQAAPNKFYSIVNKQGKKFVLNGKNLIPSKKSTKTILINDNTNESIPLSVEENAKNVVVNGNINESILPSFNESILQREIELHLPDSDVYDDFETNFSLMSNSKNTTETDNLISTLQNGTVNIVAKKNPEQAAPNKFYSIVNKQGKKFVLNGKKLIPSKITTKTILINDNTNELIPLSVEENAKNVVVNGNINESILPSFNESILQREIELHLPDSDVYDDIETNFSLMSNSKNTTETDNLISTPQNGTVNIVAMKNPEQAAPNKFYSIVNKQGKKFVLNGKNLIPSKKSTKTILINDNTNESIPLSVEENAKNVVVNGNINESILPSFNESILQREIELHLPDSDVYDDFETNFSLMSNSKNTTETDNLISTLQNGTVNIVAKKNPEQAAPNKFYSIVNKQGKKFVLNGKKLIPSKITTKTILINDNTNELIPLSVEENAKNVVVNGNINESILPSFNESILQREIELHLPDSDVYDDIETNFSLMSNSKNTTETDNLISTPQNGTVNIVAMKNPEQAAPNKFYSIVNKQGKKFVLNGKNLIPSKKSTKTILINDNTNETIPLSVEENAKNVVVNGNINESILPSFNESILQREIELHLPDSDVYDDIETNFSLMSNSKNTTETDNLISTPQNGTVNIVAMKNPEQAAPNKFYSIVNKQGKKFVLNGKNLIPSKKSTKTILINDNTNETIPLSVEENAKNVVVNGNINESILPSFNESILQREIELHLPDSDVYDDFETNFSLMSNSKNTTETDNLISTLQNGTVNIVAMKNPEQAAPNKFYSIVNKQGKKFVLNGKNLIPSKKSTKTILINDNTNETIPLSVEENAKNVVVNGNINESILPSFNESILQREIELHLPDSDVYDDIETNFSLMSNSKNTTETDNLISTPQNGTVNIVAMKNPEQAAPNKFYSIVNKQGKKFVLNGKNLIPSKKSTKTILINDNTNETIPLSVEENAKNVVVNGNINESILPSFNESILQREIELHLPDSDVYDDFETNFSLMSNSKNTTETDNLISTLQNGTVNIVAMKNPEQAAPNKFYSIVNKQGKKFVLNGKKLIPSKKSTKTILINDNTNESIPLSVEENAKNVVVNGNINESILPSFNESILQREIELDLPDSVDYDDIESNFSLLTNSKNTTETDNLISTLQNGTVNIVAKKNPEQAAPNKFYSIVNKQGKKFVLNGKKLIPSKKSTKTILINDNTNESIPLSVEENAKNVVVNGNINESILPSFNESILQREIELDLPDSVDYDDIERDFNFMSNSKNTTETDNLISTPQNGTVNIVAKKNPEQAVPNKFYSIVNKQGKKFVLNGKKLIPSKKSTKTILINDNTNESIPLSVEENAKNVVVNGNINESILPSFNESILQREIELDLPDSVDYDDIERDFNFMSNSKNTTETDNLISTPQNGTVNIVAKKNPEQAVPNKFYSIVNKQGKKFVLNGKKLIPSKKSTKTILINDNTNESIPLSVEENAKNVVVNGNLNESILPSFNESILQREIELDLPDSVDYDDIESNFSLLTNSKNNTETDNLISTLQNGTVNIVAKKNPEQAAPNKFYSIVNKQGKKFVLNGKKLIPSKKSTKTILINDNTNESIPLSVEENAKNVVVNGNINESILPSFNESILQREIELDLPDSVDYDDIERDFNFMSNSKNTTETDNLISTPQNGTVNIVAKKNPEQAVPNKFYSIVNKQGKKFVLNGKKLIPSKKSTKTILINDNTNESIPLSVEENAKNVVVNGNLNESILPSFNESILQREIELDLPDSVDYDDIESNFSLLTNSKNNTETDNLISTLQNGTVNIVAKKNPEQAAPNKFYSIVNKQGKKFVLNGKKLIPSKKSTKTILINDNTNESIPLSVEENAKNVVVNGNINESILPSFNESVLQREIELDLPDSVDYDDIERDFNLMSNSKNTTETDNLISTLQNGTVNIVAKKNPEQAAPNKFYSIVNKQGKKFVLNGKKLIPSKKSTKTILINDNTNESIPLSVEENAKNVVVNGNINESILPSFNESVLQREIELDLPDSVDYDDIERDFNLMSYSKNTTETDNLISTLENGTVNIVAKKNPEQAAPNKFYSIVNKQGKKFVLNGKKLIPSKKSTKTILINDNTNESIPLSVEENAKNVVVNGNINESILPSFNESVLQREIELDLPDSVDYDDIERDFNLMSNSKNTTETDNLISTLENGTVNIVAKKNPEQAAPNKFYSIVNKQGKKFVLNGKKLIPSKKSTKTILINDNTNESIPLSVEENAKNVVVNGNINESILPSFNESVLQREIELDLPDSVDYDDIERDFNLMSNSKNTTETDNLISPLQNGTVNIVAKKNPEQAAPNKFYSIVNKQGKKFVLNGKKLIPSKKSTKTILINDNTNESIPLSVEENAKNVVVNGNINESILPSFNESVLQREIELDLPDSVDYDDIERDFNLMSNSKNTTETDNLISTLENGTVNIVAKKNPEQAAPNKFYSIVNKQGKKFVLNGKKLIPSKKTTKTILISDNTNESIPLNVEENAKNVVLNDNINESILPSFNGPILPSVNESLLPSVNESILPNFNESILLSLNESILQSVNESILPSLNESIFPCLNESILPNVNEPTYTIVLNDNVNESILPSENESILPSLNETILPSVNKPILSSIYDSILPSVNESILPNVNESTYTIVINDNVNESILPSENELILPSLNESILPSVNESILPSLNESILQSVNESILPNLNESILQSVNESILPSLNDSIFPSLNESILPNVNESTYTIVINDNVNESILPCVYDTILPSVNERILPSVYESILPNVNESILPNEHESTYTIVINDNVNESILPNVNESTYTVVINDNINESLLLSVNDSILPCVNESTYTVVTNENVNESIPPCIKETTNKVAINASANESIPLSVKKKPTKKVKIYPSGNESILSSVNNKPTKRKKINPIGNESILSSLNNKPTKKVKVYHSGNESISSIVKKKSTKKVAINASTNESIPLNVKKKPTKSLKINASTNESLPLNVKKKPTKRVKINCSANESIPSIINKKSTKKININPSVNKSVLPSVNESILPSLNVSILPSVYESILPSVNESILPSFNESILPSVNESILPSVNESTYTIVINDNVNESILPNVNESTYTVVLNENINESILPSINESTYTVVTNENVNESIPLSVKKKPTKKVKINPSGNELLPSILKKKSTKKVNINPSVNVSILSSLNNKPTNMVKVNPSENESISSIVKKKSTKRKKINPIGNESILSSVNNKPTKRVKINPSGNESILSSVNKKPSKKVKINPSGNESILSSVNNKPTKRKKINPIENESILSSVNRKPTKRVKINPSGNESILSSVNNKPTKRVKINPSGNESIPSIVNKKPTKRVKINPSGNESIPSSVNNKPTKKVKINASGNELISSIVNKKLTKKVAIHSSANESILSSSVQKPKKVSPKKKKIANKISKPHTNTKLFKKKTNSIKSSVVSTNSITAEPKVLYIPNITTNVVAEPKIAKTVRKRKPNICQYCGKIFKKNADLERHKRTHTGDKPFKCDTDGCNKAFATKSSLKYHAVTHMGIMKRATCPQCNGLFATPSSLKIHLRQHTGEKPFKCPTCGDPFRTIGHLHTHIKIHERRAKRN